MTDGKPEECPRCGALLANLGTHLRWHERLEGTSQMLPPLQPDEIPVGRK